MKSKSCNQQDVVTQKEYFEVRLASIEKATILAHDNLKTRLDSLNEWRLQNKDERDKFVSREYFEAKLEAAEKSRRDSISLWISLVAVAIGIAGLLTK